MSTAGHAEEPSTPAAAALESQFLAPRDAQAFVYLVEASTLVMRRSQFFLWMRSQVDALLPNQLAICGAYTRPRRQLSYDVFNSTVLPRPLLEALTAADSPWLVSLAQMWVDGGCHARAEVLGSRESPWHDDPTAAELASHGLRHLLVHGTSRPERPHEIETLFMLVGAQAPGAPRVLELLVPHLHVTYQRMQSVERTLGQAPAARQLPQAAATRAPPLQVTQRELQILHWVREGKSNLDIGELLGISALTVKNHVQKVLRKLGANNRAHAVTLALRLGLLAGRATADSAVGDG